MIKFWTQLSIKSKIGYSVLIGVMQAGALCFFTFKSMFYTEQIEHLADKAKFIGNQTENVILFTAEKNKEFQSNTETAALSACEIVKKNSDIFSINVIVPNSNIDGYLSRLEKNNPDKQVQLDNGKINDYFFIDDETNTLRYIKSLMLTESCIRNTPANDKSDTKVKAYMEIVASLSTAQEVTLSNSLIIGGVTLAAASIVVIVAFGLARQIDRRLKMLKGITREFRSGNYDVNIKITGQDEICELASEFNNMADKIKHVNSSLVDEKKNVEDKIELAIKESEDKRKYLTQKTEIMLNAMNKFSEGDLTVKLNHEKDDDIGKLFEGFNKAVSNTKEMIIRVSQAITATVNSGNKIFSSSETLTSGIKNQTVQTNEVAGAIEEMTSTILQTTKNTTAAAEYSKMAGKSAKNGGEVVNQTVEGMNRIAAVVGDAASTVKELGVSSIQIGEIIQVIDDIADQTNLLALNAAIEAARAGDQGRGFAVVADEVRKLAERTTKATKEIAQMIKKIQTDTGNAVESIENGTKEVEAGKVFATKAISALEEIIGSTNETIDVINQVAAASEEQSAAAEEISKSIEGIANITNESSIGTNEISHAAEDLIGFTENLHELISRFNVGENHGQLNNTTLHSNRKVFQN